MKRGRIPDRIGTNSYSFSDLPKDVMVNVLLRLSIKRIFVCKLVCKACHDLILEPEFAKLHFDQAQACPLIQVSRNTLLSRLLYLVQPEEEDFELKFEICDHNDYKSECDCHVKFELDTKFKLPLRSLQMVFIDEKAQNRRLEDYVSNSGWKRGKSDDCFRLEMKDNKYRVVNSCNGLLCLSNPSNNEPLVVCNPVTGEFINLPEAKKVSFGAKSVLCGLGFSPATNQYKVIRIFERFKRDVKSINGEIGAEVHTIGTESWKDVEFSTKKIRGSSPTYVNGFLYWLCGSHAHPLRLVSFDIQNECFGSILAPPMNNSKLSHIVHVGILGGELSVSCYLHSGVREVWAMKHHGNTNVWSKVLSVPLHFEPIKYLNDGGLLMFSTYYRLLIYKHPKKRRLRYFKFGGTTARVGVIAHIPSFVSLKDALSGHNVKVLNVHSRCAKLKLQGEEKRIFIVEEDKVSYRRG